MILTDNKDAYDWFRTVRYEGRSISEDGVNYKLYKDDNIKSLGWNMYMTPEQASRGLSLFMNYPKSVKDQLEIPMYRDLTSFDFFKNFDTI